LRLAGLAWWRASAARLASFLELLAAYSAPCAGFCNEIKIMATSLPIKGHLTFSISDTSVGITPEKHRMPVEFLARKGCLDVGLP
jgi:hypothetical protein